MDYCTLDNTKAVLQISDDKRDSELSECVTSASALMDGFLSRQGLAVPSPLSQILADATKYFAAWDFRRRRDPVGASAFWNAPRRTGYLASTIIKEVGDAEASVDALASYAVYDVKGIRPHVIKPVNASVLAFETADGRMVFTHLVHHPGTKPNPFMQRAVEDTRSKVDEVFAELWLEMLS